VLLDMGFVLLIMAALGALSYFHPATLGPIADPSDTHFLPRPEWYYLPMFEWLKFWEGPRVVIGVIVLPGLLAMAFFLMPFLDRRLERRPWRRPIPALAVSIVVLGMVYLGVKSHFDDKQGPIAAQLALQSEQEKSYSAAPFEPYVESPDGIVPVSTSAAPANPLIAEGKGIFTERGCSGCHGPAGVGTTAAPKLVGVTGKFGQDQLIALLRSPSARMRAGRMPAVDVDPAAMSALLAYLGVLGTRAASVPAVYRVPSPPSVGSSRASALTMKADLVAGSPLRAQKTLSAAAGQQLFQEHACFVCHGKAGAGGRAPALAPLVAKLSDPQLSEVLQNPNAKMKSGGMPPVQASRDEIGNLISYLRTLAAPQPGLWPTAKAVAANTPPAADPHTVPKPALVTFTAHSPGPAEAAPAPASMVPSPGRKLFISQGCIACHGPTAHGTKIAPSLVGVTAKFPGEQLPALLHNPTSKMRAGGMPVVALDGAQMTDLLAYLSTLAPAPPEAPGTQTNTDLRGSSASQPDPAPVETHEAVQNHEAKRPL